MTDRALLALCASLAACGGKHVDQAAASPVRATASSIEVAQARAVLEQGAADLDPAVRRRALVALVESSTGDDAHSWALRALWDPNPWVQRGVIESLAEQLPDPSAQRLLFDVVGRASLDPYVRCGAALQLAVAGDTSTLESISTAWQDEVEGWRAAPCALAAAAMGDSDAERALGGILRDGELPLELGFFSDLGSSGLVGLAADLSASYSLLDEAVHVAVADALLHLDPEAGTAAFRELLSGTEAERMEGIDFLLEQPDEAAVPLLRRANTGASSRVRLYIRLALLAHGDADPDALVEAMSSDDREMRALAVHCAGLALARDSAPGEPRLVRAAGRAITAGLTDDEDLVRLAAAAAIAQSGAEGNSKALHGLLDDEQTSLRVEAAAALFAIRRQR